MKHLAAKGRQTQGLDTASKQTSLGVPCPAPGPSRASQHISPRMVTHMNSRRISLPIYMLLVCLVALSRVAPAQITGVWLQSPNPGQNPNQVQVNAIAYGPSTVTGWIIYLDDRIVYQTNVASSTISQPIHLTNGQHLLYARAWDGQGDYNTSGTLLLQVGPPPPSSTVLPTPPDNAEVLQEMQNNTADWTTCSVCAHGTTNSSNYWMAPFQNQPSRSGSSLEMYVDGLPWTNVLFIDTMLGTSSNSHFLWDFWVYHDSTSPAFWSSEFDLWQVLGGSEFMIGSQCDFGDGYWSTWDSAGNRWILNGIACPRWAPNTWHHVQWYVERISPTQYRYDTLVFDGQPYGLNQTWTINYTSWPDMIGIQYQLDQDSTGAPIHEWVDNVNLTMW